jgi:hypothetical protein
MKRSFDGPYRAGPWPGLTPAGAGLLLALAAFLAIGQLMVGAPQKPLPDLVVVSVTALLPLAIAERLVRMPGVACAVCGACLLPLSIVSLFRSSLETPPLLLVAAFGFELALWLDFADLWPWRTPKWLTKAPRFEPLSRNRAILAGAVFGLILALVEPPFRILLGADPAIWSGTPVWAAAVACGVVCATLATILSARGRAV